MSTSAFGVEHVTAIAKADDSKDFKQPRLNKWATNKWPDKAEKVEIKRKTNKAQLKNSIKTTYGHAGVGAAIGTGVGAGVGAGLGALKGGKKLAKPAYRVGAALGGSTGWEIGTVHGTHKTLDKEIKAGRIRYTHPKKGRAVGVSSWSGKRVYKDDVKKADGEYRASHLQRINPRSKTYVKEGTGLKRVGIPLVGGAAGGAIGGAVGELAGRKLGSTKLGSKIGSKIASKIAPTKIEREMLSSIRPGRTFGQMAGTLTGATPGMTRNIKSGDTVSYNRRTGKKAKAKFGDASFAFNKY